jgi:hypothetical protein
MIQAGDINLVQSIIESELRLGTLEKAFDFILSNNFSLTKPSQSQVEDFRAKTVKELQSKYPNSGISFTPNK